jgi:hypothetical protein
MFIGYGHENEHIFEWRTPSFEVHTCSLDNVSIVKVAIEKNSHYQNIGSALFDFLKKEK